MEDFTERLVDFLKSRFTGHEVFQPLTTFKDNTQTNFGIRTGNTIKAKGRVKIGSFISHEGTLSKLEVANQTLWIADPFFKITFEYSSQTHGERWIWPGGLFVDNVWGSVHPKGTISAVLAMVPQGNATIRLESTIDQQHPGDPNDFITSRVAPMTLGKMDALLEEFTGKSIQS